MAQGKHIIPTLSLNNPNKFCGSRPPSKFSIIGLIAFIFTTTESYAGAWLPEVGTYNLYSSHSYIDARSRKIRNIRKEAFIDIQSDIQELGMVRDLIPITLNKMT